MIFSHLFKAINAAKEYMNSDEAKAAADEKERKERLKKMKKAREEAEKKKIN